MRFLIILFSIFLGFEDLVAQSLNENYMLFSNSENESEYIEFKSDSILIRKPYYSNTSCNLARLQEENKSGSIYKEYEYKKENDSIIIYKFENNENIKFEITGNNYFENSERKEVYVKRNSFEKFPDVAITYENNIYWVDSPETSNGIITKKGKKNGKLKKVFKNIKPENIDSKIYRGYKAFKNFGYKYVFGIIEIKNKDKNGS